MEEAISGYIRLHLTISGFIKQIQTLERTLHGRGYIDEAKPVYIRLYQATPGYEADADTAEKPVE